jgi:hypothetical protein
MAYTTQYALGTDGVMQQRVIIAMLNTAVNVQAEVNTTPNHTNRANFAKLVINNPYGYVPAFQMTVMADGTITAASTDAQIQSRSDAIWNAAAGTI